MNILDTSTKFKVPVAALRRLEKGGLLKFDKPNDNEYAAKIRFTLMRKGTLSVEMLLALIHAPDLIYDLRKYEDAARAQLAALGDYRGQAAPIEVYAVLADATGGDPVAAQAIADWLTSILPVASVPHHWVAVRLLVALDERQRAVMLGKVSFALMHMRKLESFVGYWESVEVKTGRKEIRYFQKKLDL